MKKLINIWLIVILLFIGCKNDDDQVSKTGQTGEEIEFCLTFKNESRISLSDFQFKIFDKDDKTLLLDRTDFDEEIV